MATLYITYLGNADKNIADDIIGSVTLTTSGLSAAAAAAPTNAQIALVYSDTAHYVTFGAGTPTAEAANSIYVPANFAREFRINAARTASRIAAITV